MLDYKTWTSLQMFVYMSCWRYIYGTKSVTAFQSLQPFKFLFDQIYSCGNTSVVDTGTEHKTFSFIVCKTLFCGARSTLTFLWVQDFCPWIMTFCLPPPVATQNDPLKSCYRGKGGTQEHNFGWSFWAAVRVGRWEKSFFMHTNA